MTNIKSQYPTIPIITGATAVGKTDLTVELANYFDIEIISVDAYQIYQFMNIGTACPSKEVLSQVKHHLVDELHPKEHYSAGIFFDKIDNELIEDIVGRGKIPIISGGTPMYINSIVCGMFDESIPKAKTELEIEAYRNEIREMSENGKLSSLYEKLQAVDCEYSQKISPNDTNRILRALELNYSYNSNVQIIWKNNNRKTRFNFNVIWISQNRQKIYDNIDRRVEKMIEAGWVSEVENLVNMGLTPEFGSMKAIGYPQLYDVIVNGKPLNNAIEDTKTKTRNFAKRQEVWFKSDKFSKIILEKDNLSNAYFKEIIAKIVGI